MGGSYSSGLSNDRINEYAAFTYLSEDEIDLCAKNFKLWALNKSSSWEDLYIDWNVFKELPEFKENPFVDRIYHVFKASGIGEGKMYFEDFLDMMSVFSRDAPKDLKIYYAFKILTFQEQEIQEINESSIKEIVKRSIGPNNILNKDEHKEIAKRIFKENSINDGKISFEEFKLMISFSPDFADSFCVRIKDYSKLRISKANENNHKNKVNKAIKRTATTKSTTTKGAKRGDEIIEA